MKKKNNSLLYKKRLAILDLCKNIAGSNINDPVACLKKAREKI